MSTLEKRKRGRPKGSKSRRKVIRLKIPLATPAPPMEVNEANPFLSPMGNELPLSATVATTGNPSPDYGTAVSSAADGFEETAARILEESGEAPGDVLDGGPGDPPEIVSGIVSAKAVSKNLPIPFRAFAEITGCPDLALLDYEVEMISKPLTDCINRYVPLWLRGTQHPELVMLGTVVCFYLMRIGQTEWAKQLFKRGGRKMPSSVPDTMTAVFPASSAS